MVAVDGEQAEESRPGPSSWEVAGSGPVTPPIGADSDTGEVNYEYLFEVIDAAGYEGWIGCEYIPKAGTSEGLGWFNKYAPATV